ncbi:hypothetical protein [Sphingopyxis sp. GW247-27LB]|uniref:hypothetical protein n=1 Tax=Sphingopyxis sp. GW247-27LB TaxID=2012632 RepID=UPI000BA5579F|nr:hypothetical protein [Sphingopyxis sp. GW247-27LB]PAL25496.1 hypothetical protein CD928_03210 [Sphingopyxis sp. GW247-27LB]
MFGLSGLRLYGAIGGMLAFGAMLLAAWTGVQARADLKDLRGDVAACSRAAEKIGEPADRCAEPVKAAIAAARAAGQCDVALAAGNRDATRFAIQSACSTAVKAEVAARTAAEDGQRQAEAEVDRLIADQAKIADRAEARGRAATQRKDAADAAIQSAPPAVGSGTGKRCDAQCLRRLSGKA